MPQVVAAKPKVLPYPRIESSSSSSKKLSGGKLFADNFDAIQVFEVACLYTINQNACLLGSLIGAAKPFLDYRFKHVIPKYGHYEINQDHFGQLVIVDQEIDEYNERHKKDHKKTGNEVSGVTTYAVSRMMVIGITYLVTRNFYNVGSFITGALALSHGFNLSQRMVQFWGSPPAKK